MIDAVSPAHSFFEAYMKNNDPIFNLPTPVFFAHRGGAAEAPESTIESFIRALKIGANVIEVDLQLTQDEQILVWHGPELDITYNEKGYWMKGQFVHCWKLADLQEQLHVRHPKEKTQKPNDQRRLITLDQLVDFLNDLKAGKYEDLPGDRAIHLNLELKKISDEGSCDAKPSWTAPKKDDFHPMLHKLLDTLKNAPEGTRIVVGSGYRYLIEAFRHTLKQRQKDDLPYIATNLALVEQLPYIAFFDPSKIKYLGWLSPLIKILFKGIGLIVKKDQDLTNIALETPSAIVSPELVQEVHRRGGGIYVFLTPFKYLQQPEVKAGDPFKADYQEQVDNLLKIGVDGLMTDYPAKLAGALTAAAP